MHTELSHHYRTVRGSEYHRCKLWESYSQDFWDKINSGLIAKDTIKIKWNRYKWPSCPVSEIHWALFNSLSSFSVYLVLLLSLVLLLPLVNSLFRSVLELLISKTWNCDWEKYYEFSDRGYQWEWECSQGTLNNRSSLTARQRLKFSSKWSLNLLFLRF